MMYRIFTRINRLWICAAQFIRDGWISWGEGRRLLVWYVGFAFWLWGEWREGCRKGGWYRGMWDGVVFG